MLAGRCTVRLADPPEQGTAAGSPCRPGDEVKTHLLAFLAVALSRTLPPEAGSDVTLALKCVITGTGAALAGRPVASRHSTAPAAAATLRPRMLFMPDIFHAGCYQSQLKMNMR